MMGRIPVFPGRVNLRRAWPACIVLAAVVVAAAVAAAGAGTARAAAKCPWVGSSAPIAQRVAMLMEQMGTSDKLLLLHGVLPDDAQTSGPVYAGSTSAIPGLCVPSLNLQDGPAGVGDGLTGVTQLPAPVDLAATWSPKLAREYGDVVGAEDRGKGATIDLGPTVNIVRDPRWGRAFETYGEDPYLQGAIADGYIDGVQSQGVMAQVKHLVAYSEETGRDGPTSDAIVSDRALQEIYLPPFQDAVQQAHVASVMCSYNEVNNVPACGNGYTLGQVLDGEFGFKGFVTSDWFATQSAAPSANAGLDMQMPDGCYFGTGLPEALSSGGLTMARLDDMVQRVLTQMFRFGMFNYPASGSPNAVVTTPAHVAVARNIAEAGTVLLKNAHGVLPLSARTVHSIAVIGADGGSGAYTGGGGSASVVPSSVVTPYQGIAAAAPHGVKVTYDDGSSTSSAEAAAHAASVAVVFVDLPEAEGQDLQSIDLPGNDDTLIGDVAAANPRTIVVLNTGSAVTMPWLNSVAGVLAAWYPGQDDGAALAAILFGKVDPSGRLPVTFPVALSQGPTTSPVNWPGTTEQEFTEGIFVGYRWYQEHNETPLFPFGYGLTYTSFSYRGARVGRPTRAGDVHVSVTVRNRGRRAGSDVVQLYIGDPAADGEPPRQLVGFDKVTLRPGKSTKIRFTLRPRSMSYWNNRWVATRGAYQLYIGDSSASLPVHLRFTLKRTIVSGAPVGPAPKLASDSPALVAQCPEDALAPDVAAILTLEGDGQGVLSSLP
jgi:beta-glucosidase